MSVRHRAYTIVALMAVFVVILAIGLGTFARQGQIQPASMTNDAVKSDQREATVSSDVANHQKK